MDFLTDRDMQVVIKDRHLQQMLAGSPFAQDDAEAMALGAVRDALHYRYDVDAIYADAAAYPNVRRWVLVVTIYYLYQRLPDNFVPARVVSDYEDAVKTLGLIADGKRAVALPRRDADADEDGVQAYGTFRGGFVNRRSH